MRLIHVDVKSEVFRVVFMILSALACFILPDVLSSGVIDWTTIKIVLYVFGFFFSMALISHVTRKYAFFPYLDMKLYLVKALENPIASSIVFAATTGFLATCIYVASQFFTNSKL